MVCSYKFWTPTGNPNFQPSLIYTYIYFKTYIKAPEDSTSFAGRVFETF